MKITSDLRPQARGLIGGLVVQYILGMATALYVTFPENQSVKQLRDFANTQPVLIAHAIWGILLLLGAIVLMVRATKARDKTWKIAAGIGLGSIIFAALAGSQFVDTQNDKYSLTMAIFFIVALVSYGWGLYQTKP